MYVADMGNHRIQRFPPGSGSSTLALTVAGFNLGAGSGYSELYNPMAISVASNGTMYILDSSNYRVLRWLPGEPVGVAVVGGRGSGTTLDKIGVSYAMFLDARQNIYVSEYGNHRISLWTSGNNITGVLVSDYFDCDHVAHFILYLGGW